MTKIICIYAIRCKVNNKQYVGSAVSFKHRIAVHKNYLNKNKHPNRYLQFAWNKYGEENFEFYIVERLKDNKDLYIKEQYWIDTYKCLSPDGFNLDAVAGSRLGSKLSEEAKAKISAFHKGRVVSRETRLKLSQSNKGKSRPDLAARNKARAGTSPSEETKLKMSNKAIERHKQKFILNLSKEIKII